MVGRVLFAAAAVTIAFTVAAEPADPSAACFPNCEPLQCTGVYGPREGPQERWTETARWLKEKVPSAFVDERIVMAPGRFGDQVTTSADAITRGEILMRLPVSTFLLEEDCFPTEAFAQLGTGYNSSLKIPPKITWNISKSNGADFTQAGLCLLMHRLLGNESAYAGYIRHLPRQSSDQTYMFRPLPEIEILKGTDAFRIASVVKRRLMAQLDKSTGEGFAMIREYFPHLNWTVEEFKAELLQTLSLCGSRTFNLESSMLMPSKKQDVVLYRPALVPLLDMLNHGDARTRNCQYFFNTTGQVFQLQAIRDIRPGEELVHSYGPRCNAELLFFYGFMMDGNTEDFVSVADLTQGALDYNYHTRLGHSLRCHAPYFRPVEGSDWPPRLQVVIEHASPDESASTLSLGPLSPSEYYAFASKLQAPHSEDVRRAFAKLARFPQASVDLVEGEFVVKVDEAEEESAMANESLRGDLELTLLWQNIALPPDCMKITRPRCQELTTDNATIGSVLLMLQRGLAPEVERAGGCHIWADNHKVGYEVKLAGHCSWVGVATKAQPQSVNPTGETVNEADLFREFYFKRQIIRQLGLQKFIIPLTRDGLLPETLLAIRIALLPSLSSLAVHDILSGGRLEPRGEEQLARTISMFCFEELARRLQVLGVDSEPERLDVLVGQAQAMAKSVATGSYANLARNELGFVADFCSTLLSWELDVWSKG